MKKIKANMLFKGMKVAVILVTFLVASCGGGNDGASMPSSNTPMTSNPNPIQTSSCVGKNYYTLQPVPAVEQSSPITAGNAYAIANFDMATGVPVITFGPRFYQLQPLLQVFVRYHECQHANGVFDEIAANCSALSQMRSLGLSRAEEEVIAQWHRQEGIIGVQYGGTGENYWARTLQCAGARQT